MCLPTNNHMGEENRIISISKWENEFIKLEISVNP